MFITPINKSNLQSKISIKPDVQVNKQVGPQSASLKPDFAPSFNGAVKIHTESIMAIKLEMLPFLNDIKYRKQLMISAGKKAEEYYKLRSILGVDEIKSIMKKFNNNESVYSTGINDENIRNKAIRANLHIHTLASDGFMSTQELLDKAALYANEVAKNPANKRNPFIIAITDHDTAEGAKEAIEIIAQDPLKYKNLRVVLGTEFTTYNNIATDIVHMATNTHILAYGIDPNEHCFNKFINDTKTKKHEIAVKMINQANKTYQKAFNVEDDFFLMPQARNFYNPINKNIIGIYNYVEHYIETKLILDEGVLKNYVLAEKLKQNKLPSNVDELMDEMQEFYYELEKNNRPRNPMESVPMFLANKIGMKEDVIKELIQDSPKSKGFKSFEKNIQGDLNKYKRTLSPKYDYMPTISDIHDEALKNQPHTIMGSAHPLDTVYPIVEPEKRYEFLTELYKQFKEQAKEKATFSEVYYQSYAKPMKDFKENPHTQAFLNKLSEENNLFKTGSADSHRTSIFKRLD